MTSDHVAVSDCERIRPGPVAQPANTASSLAFYLVGLRLWTTAARSPQRLGWRVAAVTAGVVGLGSAAYHGPGGRASRVVHDASNVLLLPVVTAAARSSGRPPRPRLRLLAAGCAAAGVAAHRLSRTGGPLCRPDSVLQGHAAWHLLEAAALLALGAAYLPDRPSVTAGAPAGSPPDERPG